MIDLHMHTTYSDGTDSLVELLNNANKKNLKVISITDHDTVDSYKELDNLNIDRYYDGRIIVGCEFTTSFDDRLIEVLGYGFDYKKIDEYLNSFYTDEFMISSRMTLYNRLVSILKEYNLKYDNEVIENAIKDKFYLITIYNELIKYPLNKNILNENLFNSYSDFIRKGIYNKNSKLFLNHAEFKPKIEEIINIIHYSGGICFLAHPFQYKFNDTEDFLNKIYNETSLDGIECFYTMFTEAQTEYIKDFANKRGLLLSGGSDYHGKNKQNHSLGIGRGNLNISDEILENYNITYYK